MTDNFLSYFADAFKDMPSEVNIFSLFSDICKNTGTFQKNYLEKELIEHGMSATGEPTKEPTAENTYTGWETD